MLSLWRQYYNADGPCHHTQNKNDRTVNPDLERFFAKRMDAKVTEVQSSHVPMLSHPDLVIDVIRAAARAVQGVAAERKRLRGSDAGHTSP